MFYHCIVKRVGCRVLTSVEMLNNLDYGILAFVAFSYIFSVAGFSLMLASVVNSPRYGLALRCQ